MYLQLFDGDKMQFVADLRLKLEKKELKSALRTSIISNRNLVYIIQA